MKSALLILFSCAILHGEGDETNHITFGDVFNNDERWEEGEIHILQENENRKRSRRNTNSNNFPEIKIISGKRQLDIQLEPLLSSLNSIHFRDGEFVTEVPLLVEEDQDERLNCHWKGYVRGGGSATFSTCQDANSFTGAILTDEGLWLVRPKDQAPQKSSSSSRVKSRSRRQEQYKVQPMPHLVLPPEKTAVNVFNAVSDVARVPLDELEAAARLSAKDTAERDAQRESDYDDEEQFVILLPENEGNDYSDNSNEEYDQVPLAGFFSYFPRWLRWDYYNKNYNRDEDDFSINFPFLDDTNNNGNGRERRPLLNVQHPTTILMERKIRELENKKKWVEMALFTDESMYKRMGKKYPNDTLAKLKDYATTMVNTMDLLYGDKSLGVDIGFRLVHLEVMKKPPKALDTNGGKAKAYLSSFCDYAGNQNVNSGSWDHGLLLTGLDLHEQGLKSTAGLAWSGTMCYRYYSCSVAEGNSLGAAFIITHEIGHSLGMEHDGIGVSETCDRDKYIMSPTTGAGKVSWSNCSGKNLQDFIDYGTSELRSKKYPSQMLSKPTCLSEIVTKGKSSTTKLKLPGENYDAYFQCALGLGSDFKPYFQRNKSPFNNICNILYCGNGTHAVSTHPALEGTKCDKDKFCRRGSCIKRPSRR